MFVLVGTTDTTLFKLYLYHHDVFVVTYNLAGGSLAGRFPFHVLFVHEYFAVISHIFLILLLGKAAGGKQCRENECGCKNLECFHIQCLYDIIFANVVNFNQNGDEFFEK